MKRFILSDAQSMEAILEAAATALAAIGCQYVLIAEDANGVSRRGSDSFQWARGALENSLDDIQEAREEMMHQPAEDESGEFGPAEPA
jgi:DNA invertase Pin-like site-specific DNA recombinase